MASEPMKSTSAPITTAARWPSDHRTTDTQRRSRRAMGPRASDRAVSGSFPCPAPFDPVRPTRKWAQQIGTSVIETRYDAPMANATVTARGVKRKRPSPLRNTTGKKTTAVVIVATRTGIATSLAASRAACKGGFPSARCRCVFSSTTMASSTNRPRTSAKPPRVMMFRLLSVK